MDKELQKYYEDRFSMMVTSGWKDLVEDAEGMLNEYNKVTNIGASTSVDFRKGQIDILTWLIGLKDISELSYKELTHEEIL